MDYELILSIARCTPKLCLGSNQIVARHPNNWITVSK